VITKVSERILLIDGIGSANVFLLLGAKGYSLIDTGIFMKTKALIFAIEGCGLAMSDLETIYLTHCHCDHIGGVRELLRHSGAKVAAHRDDIPFILQERVIAGHYHEMMIEEQKAMKRLDCNVQRVDIVLEDGGFIDEIGGLEVISVSGHTPGSVAFYQRDQEIMFFGDVIRNTDKRGLTIGIPEKFNYDTEQTRKDARKLLEYPITCALFSHGAPILKNAEKMLSELI
jgi:glyoxylase-like metal-dependent hydrolase (beta-lactamase superfamily II)